MAEESTPPNDPAILDEWTLLRRVAPSFYKGEGPDTEMASGVFDDSKDGSAMSVFVLETLLELGLDQSAVLDGFGDEYGMVGITARQARDEEFGVVMAPNPGDGLRGLAHAQVYCKKRRPRQQHLKKGCVHLAGRLAPGQE